MKSLSAYLKKAKENKWSIGQFNFSTLEQLRAIFEAARENNSPVILGTSEGESRFFGLEEIIAIVKIFRKKYNVPAFLNLDHGKDPVWIKKAIDSGYDAVHFDGSSLDLAENTVKTKEIVNYARAKKVLIEGELGRIQGESKFHHGSPNIEKENLTNPDDVGKFCLTARINSLAISIGNTHGVFEREQHLDLARLAEIKKETKVFLVLHGGSGIRDDEIRRAITLGINKINFNTELRIVWKETIAAAFLNNPDEMRPYRVLAKVQENIKKKVEQKIHLINSQNKI